MRWAAAWPVNRLAEWHPISERLEQLCGRLLLGHGADLRLLIACVATSMRPILPIDAPLVFVATYRWSMLRDGMRVLALPMPVTRTVLEPGVAEGAFEIAKRGHPVWIITRRKNAPMSDYVEGLDSVEIDVIAYDLPHWMRWWKRGARGVQVYYALWQIGAFFCARAWHRRIQFDVVHHLTFGVFRTPGWMWMLGIPYVLGPIGGAEMTPKPLTRSFRRSAQLIEAVRRIANRFALLDPSLIGALRGARWVYACTRETRLPAQAISIENRHRADHWR